MRTLWTFETILGTSLGNYMLFTANPAEGAVSNTLHRVTATQIKAVNLSTNIALLSIKTTGNMQTPNSYHTLCHTE